LGDSYFEALQFAVTVLMYAFDGGFPLGYPVDIIIDRHSGAIAMGR
jgi:hypothetical protein